MTWLSRHAVRCTAMAKHDLVMAHLADLLAGAAVLEPWLVFAQAIRDNDLNCGVSDQDIQRRQLDELNAFIESHMAYDRPAIVMGDFNIDGKDLGDAGSMYREMLRRLHIGPHQPKPVTVGLELAKLEYPPKFHPTWKHDLELGVASYDASNQGDCSGAVDPYVSMWAGFVDQQDQHHWDMLGNRSFVCQDAAAASFPADTCMVNWRYETIEQGTEKAHAYGPGLFDQDSTSGNDELCVCSSPQPSCPLESSSEVQRSRGGKT